MGIMGNSDMQNAGHLEFRGEDKRRKNIYTTALFIVVFLIVSYFITRSISSQWGIIRNYPWQFHHGWFICSGILLWVVSINLIYLWRFLLFTVSGKKLKFGVAFQITVLSNLGKYLPGKVWSVLGMFYLLNREGYSTSSALACSILHQAFTLIAGTIFIFAVLGREIFRDMSFLPLVLGIIFIVSILHPALFSRLLNWGLRIFKRKPILIKLSHTKALCLLIFYILAWIIYGAAFWCLLHALGVQPGPFWNTVASFGAAYLLGFLALFAPGGLGVREGVLSVLLAATLGPGLAALIAVAARLWMTSIEASQLIPMAIAKSAKIWRAPRKK